MAEKEMWDFVSASGVWYLLVYTFGVIFAIAFTIWCILYFFAFRKFKNSFIGYLASLECTECKIKLFPKQMLTFPLCKGCYTKKIKGE